jgi:hypothetical protein
VSTTPTNKLQFKVDRNRSGELPLTPAHFEVERECFGHIRQCPETFADFDRCYRTMSFIACTVLANEVPIAFKVVEKITSSHYHSFVTAVSQPHRHLGIARRMSEALFPDLHGLGVKHLSKFCVPQAAALEFEDHRFVLTPIHPALSETEVFLLSSLKAEWQSTRIVLARVQPAYYELCNGLSDDAIFKAYTLK